VGWTRKDLLGIAELDAAEVREILDTAVIMKEISAREIKKVPVLRGKTAVNLFFESSTRTRVSFEIAQKRLSADSVNVSASGSSVSKGETLLDTARNLEAMRPDLIIVRHSCPGAPRMLAERLASSVINAGDGAHEHPTQALLDAFTVRERLGRIEGLTVGIFGDIAHSRVARSDTLLFAKLGARVLAGGPPTMIPPGFGELGAEIVPRLEEMVPAVDVLIMLRIQLERQGGRLFPSAREYANLFGLGGERLLQARPGLLVMHPGPINRGLEISPEVADGPRSVILDQVTNGVAVRMAVLFLLSGAGRGAGAADAVRGGER
jgi:aspartate carbamoyltransferase catalytic subunit